MCLEQAYNKMSHFIFKIETPFSAGTGFLCYKNDSYCVIATAYHVIEDAHKQQTPIKIIHYNTLNGGWILPGLIITSANPTVDSAVVIIETRFLPFVNIFDKLPEFLPVGFSQTIGSKVCWLGFPRIQSDALCIFSGIISGRIYDNGNMYLVDGVAIHGVSGGPLIAVGDNGNYKVVGVINQYIPNIIKASTDISLPGLTYARDVSHFVQVVHTINSFEELNKNKQEIEQKL